MMARRRRRPHGYAGISTRGPYAGVSCFMISLSILAALAAALAAALS
jgi:hypothetical protein